MSVRISATDWQDGGLTGDDAVAVARAFAEAGCDLIDVSTGQTTPDAEPIYGRMFQTPFSDQIRNDAGIATMCVGAITSADQVNTIIAAGRADLVALARPHLVDPSFTMKAAAWYGADAIACPPQYRAGRDQIVPQQRARPRGTDRAEAQGQAENPRHHVETGRRIGRLNSRDRPLRKLALYRGRIRFGRQPAAVAASRSPRCSFRLAAALGDRPMVGHQTLTLSI